MSFQDRLQQSIDADYQIERELGGGGMSRVFVATERALQRRVVIKVLPPELSAGVNVDRFRREIQLAAQLQHPHIVPLLATGDKDGILWFSMPFIEGESLRGALNIKKRLPARDVVRVLHDVVDALAYAHARGIVHRDIKPDNILTSGMHAMVTDFGVAKALSAAIPMAGGTTTGMAIGTPAYMAPEQLAADPAADHRVDIYAVGLLAYELVTGHSPFTGTSPQATMAAQLTETPKPPSQFAQIPDALSALIMRCLEKDAAKRPQSAQALLADLDALPPLSSGTSAASRPMGRRTPLIVGALAVAAALTVVVAQQWRSRTAANGDVASNADSSATPATAGASRTPNTRVRPETVVVYRQELDNAAGIQIPVVISRAESLAIADAFARRILDAERASGAQRAPAADTKAPLTSSAPASEASVPAAPGGAAAGARGSIAIVPSGGASPAATAIREATVLLSGDGKTITLDRAQLLAELGKIFADSVAQMYGRMDSANMRASRVLRFDTRASGRSVTPMLAPPSDGRLRVVVSNYANATNKPELGRLTRGIAHAVRRALSTQKYDVISDENTDKAAQFFGDPLSMGFGLRADVIIDGVVSQRGDSLLVATRYHDLRDGRGPRMTSLVMTPGESQKVIDAASIQVNSWLEASAASRAQRISNPSRSPSGGRQGGGEFGGGGPSSQERMLRREPPMGGMRPSGAPSAPPPNAPPGGPPA